MTSPVAVTGTFRGAWVSGASYNAQDLVTYGGLIYVASAAHTSGATFAGGSWSAVDQPGNVYNVQAYGAKGDGSTDDTAAINAAIAAAYAAGVANGSYYGEVYFPPARYTLSSATTKTAATKGNSQIPLPIHPTTSTKFVLVLRGTRAGTALPHWQQTSVQTAGSVLVSTLTGLTFDGTWGGPSVLGGPTPAQGYGQAGSLFNNMLVVVDGLSIVVPSNPTIMGFDFSGMAQANILSASVNASTVPGTSLPTFPTSSWAVGVYMPQTTNNDKGLILDFSVEGMYIGLLLSEHAAVVNAQAIYCKIGIDVLNNGDFVWIGHASIEICQIMIQAEPGGSATHIKAELVDIEWVNSGAFAMTSAVNDPNNLFFGEIGIHVKDPSAGDDGPTVTGGTNCRIVDVARRPGAITAPAVPASTVAAAAVYRDAAVTVTGGTVSAITVDGTATGLTSGTVIVPAGRSIAVTYTVAPAWKWVLL